MAKQATFRRLVCYTAQPPVERRPAGGETIMMPVLLGSMLSLLFFSVVLVAESRGGDARRRRELLVIIGIMALVAAYASHAVATGGSQLASLPTGLLSGG